MSLGPEDQTHARRLVGGKGTRVGMVDAVAASIDKLLAVGDAGSTPLLQDIDVFVAQKLLAEPGAAIDARRIEALLDAWQEAEGALRPEARVAVRLVEAVVREVLSSPNRDAFARWFAREVGPRVAERHVKYMRMFLGVLIAWIDDGGWRSEDEGHYLEHLMRDMFRRVVLPVVTAKTTAYVVKRMQVAGEVLDDLMFA